MKWILVVLACLGACLAILGWWFSNDGNKAPQSAVPERPKVAAKAMEEAAKRQMVAKLPGAQILKNYASAATRPEDDLQAMAQVFSTLQILVKGDAPFRMGANEEFAAALMGKNAAREVFLTAPHVCLNDQGQIIDRWGTPLFFHVRDASRIDLRSAGPDRKMWTADDLHRCYDGTFERGASLPVTERKAGPGRQ